jgi:hypothetical protein
LLNFDNIDIFIMTKPTLYKYIDQRLAEGGDEAFRVPIILDSAASLMRLTRSFWCSLGRLEQKCWEEKTECIDTPDPVYICGLARSGSTILLNTFFGTGIFATHRYRDYPFIDIPLLWNNWLMLAPFKKGNKRERAHMDGLTVEADSPEALEEIIWMHFFPEILHNQSVSNVLDGTTENKSFEDYYRCHIKKLLIVQGKSRYLAKGNYNLTRIEYLQKLFPRARFIIPIRNAVAHIASLMKQHYLFCRVGRKNTRALRYLRNIGHFEFGPDRRIINIGNSKAIENIEKQWNNGREIEGWANYWVMLHEHIYSMLASNTRLREASILGGFDQLCGSPETTLNKLFTFCDISVTNETLANLAAGIKQPDYYQTGFNRNEIERIQSITGPTEEKLFRIL